MELRTDGRWPAAHFTAEGLAALHRLAQDRRALDRCVALAAARLGCRP